MRIKPKTPSQSTVPTKNVLLIDGESLLKQGFHGKKQIQTEAGSIGTIYHFFNQIRRFYNDFMVTKVVVFWEGENSKLYRRNYYPFYKSNRNDLYTAAQLDDQGRQRLRIKQYLEELFIRQVEVHGCEADDGIAVYAANSPNELKIIYTGDRDLLQLISPYTRVYLFDKGTMITDKNFQQHFPYHRENAGLMKMIAGDPSDNICGLMGIGEGVALKLFPELKEEKKSVEWVLERTRELLQKKPKSVQLKNIIEGNTKWGTRGREYFTVMNLIINLEHPHITDEMVEMITEAVNEPLDPEGRGGVTAIMRLAQEDKALNLFDKSHQGFLDFWSPFLTIIQNEKNFYNKAN